MAAAPSVPATGCARDRRAPVAASAPLALRIGPAARACTTSPRGREAARRCRGGPRRHGHKWVSPRVEVTSAGWSSGARASVDSATATATSMRACGAFFDDGAAPPSGGRSPTRAARMAAAPSTRSTSTAELCGAEKRPRRRCAAAPRDRLAAMKSCGAAARRRAARGSAPRVEAQEEVSGGAQGARGDARAAGRGGRRRARAAARGGPDVALDRIGRVRARARRRRL